MYCTNCGKPKNSDTQFCQYCGAAYEDHPQFEPPTEENKVSESLYILPIEQSEEKSSDEKPVIKKHKKSPVKKIIALVVLTCVLVFIGGGAYFVLNFVASYRAALSNGGNDTQENLSDLAYLINMIDSMSPYFSLIFSGDLSAAQEIWAAQEYQAAQEYEAELAYKPELDGDPGLDGVAVSVGKTASDGATVSDNVGKITPEMASKAAPSVPYSEKSSAPKEKTPVKQKNEIEDNRVNSYEYVKEMYYILDAQPESFEGYYEGDTINSIPHGFGTYIYLDSNRQKCQYDGGFVDGRFEGYGEKKFDNGAGFEGEYKNNLLNGFGKRYIKGHRLQYEGIYVDGKCQGNGKIFSNDKIVFEGVFTDDIPDEQLYKAECATLAYDDLVRLPEKYEQTPIMVTGKVVQIVAEKDRQLDLRIATSDGRHDTIYITYDRKDGEGRILKGDEVCFWGQSWGIINTTRELGGKIDLPGMRAYYVSVEQPE